MNERVSEQTWSGYDYARWKRFIAHDYSNPSRLVAYAAVESCLSDRRLSFCEIGFGDAQDFRQCFKALHDEGKMAYTGMDFMQQFASYAKTDFPDYNFKQGEFLTLLPMEFDVTYTRHVLQHQAPDSYEECIRKMLGASRRYAIITWHPPLDKEGISFSNGGWCNCWDKEKVDALIRDCGFEITEIPAGDDVVYKMEKVTNG